MRVHVSLSAADPLRLGAVVRRLEETPAAALHLDISDGVFAPAIAGGLELAHALAGAGRLPLEVHLMVGDAERQLEMFAPTGASRILVHAEAVRYPSRIAATARRLGVEVGFAANPATPLEQVAGAALASGWLTLLTSEPDGAGEPFLPGMLERVAAARTLLGPAVTIEVDGGVRPELAPGLHAAGADVVVAGRAVLEAADWRSAVRRLSAERPAA